MRWVEATAAFKKDVLAKEIAVFEKQYWQDLIAQTGGDMRAMMRLSGIRRTSVHKILARNGLARPHKARPECIRTGNWALHGL